MRRNWVRGLLSGAAMAVVAAVQSGAALADSVTVAMEKAYATNPTLNAGRAGQRAIDEQVPQALSGWRPSVTVRGEVSRTYEDTASSGASLFGNGFNKRQTDTAGVNITLSQPVFRGFRTVEGTRAAEARVDAGQQNLLQTEQQVLFNAVQAYMNVYSGRQLVNLQKQNVAALQAQVRAANERFNVGEITRTDVAQARARLAQAMSTLTDVEATLAGDVAEYLQVIGDEPGKLSYPKIKNLPKNLKLALQIAGEMNPQILARAFVEVAAQHDIGVAFSGLLPQASLEASATISDPDLSSNAAQNRTASITANVAVPLYEAGLVYSQVREAKQIASQRQIQVIEIARAVRQAVAATWNAYIGAGKIIENSRTQVAAAELALNGTQQEYEAGTRTTLDVLDAQRELVTAKVLLVNAEKQRVIFGYQLLSALGHLTAKDLGLNVAIYDPQENYNRVRNKWIGTDVDTVQ